MTIFVLTPNDKIKVVLEGMANKTFVIKRMSTHPYVIIQESDE